MRASHHACCINVYIYIFVNKQKEIFSRKKISLIRIYWVTLCLCLYDFKVSVCWKSIRLKTDKTIQSLSAYFYITYVRVSLAVNVYQNSCKCIQKAMSIRCCLSKFQKICCKIQKQQITICQLIFVSDALHLYSQCSFKKYRMHHFTTQWFFCNNDNRWYEF